MSKKIKREKVKKEKGKNLVVTLRQSILDFLNSHPGKGYSAKNICKKLNLKKKDDIKQATRLLYDLRDDEVISQLKNGDFTTSGAPEEGGIVGIVDHVNSRFAYVRLGSDRPDIYIKAKDLGSAVDGDTVKITILRSRHGEHQEGKVNEVIKPLDLDIFSCGTNSGRIPYFEGPNKAD